MTGIMDDREFEKLIKTIDTEVVPPEGLKEKLFARVMVKECKAEPVLTPFERFIFKRPLRAACIISILISGPLWAIMGSGFAELLSDMIG